MCNAIGVDPLAGSNIKGKNRKGGGGGGGVAALGGGIWTQVLGGDVNDFYFEVAGRIVEICRETREENGGLIAIDDCIKAIARGKAIGGGLEVSSYVTPNFFHFASHLILINLFKGRHPPRRQMPRTTRLRLLHHQSRQQTIHPLSTQRTKHRPIRCSRSYTSPRLRH